MADVEGEWRGGMSCQPSESAAKARRVESLRNPGAWVPAREKSETAWVTQEPRVQAREARGEQGTGPCKVGAPEANLSGAMEEGTPESGTMWDGAADIRDSSKSKKDKRGTGGVQSSWDNRTCSEISLTGGAKEGEKPCIGG